MEIKKTLSVKNRSQWRKWLKDHFSKENEIWLVFPHQASGVRGIAYNDAVEEALCFGWIDSTVKALDKNNKAQRFTPRNPFSSYSQANIERLKWLYGRGRLHPTVKKAVKDLIRETFVFPEDIIRELKKDKTAWANYKKYSPAYRRIRIAYIDGARKRPEEFKKRLENFIQKTRDNKMIGYGGIDKYY